MKINRRWLRISLIIIALISLLVALEYVNNLVNYNNEVRGLVKIGQLPSPRQRTITNSVLLSKIAFGGCLAMLILVIIVRTAEPKFKGKFTYYGE